MNTYIIIYNNSIDLRQCFLLKANDILSDEARKKIIYEISREEGMEDFLAIMDEDDFEDELGIEIYRVDEKIENTIAQELYKHIEETDKRYELEEARQRA